MAVNIGIVGLPNVGKSTLFNALSAAEAEAQNFPFCTIEPNVGVVGVPDPRLNTLAKIFESQKIIPAALEFVDIAGLVKGAAAGEGLGNKFLSHIRQVDAIAQVVRCFDDDNVTHVHGSVDPLRDIEIIESELCLKDLDTVEKRMQKSQKLVKAAGKQGEQARAEIVVLEKLESHLNDGKSVRTYAERSDAATVLLQDLHLLTDKPQLYIANVSEDEAGDPSQNQAYQKLCTFAQEQGAEVVPVSAAIEAEISQLSTDEQNEFLETLGLSEPGLHRVVRGSFELLGLITYLTAGPQEARAWTIKRGMTAPQAAGVIHTDFERGFIKAEVMNFKDLVELGSESAVKQAGKMRMEGKEYVVVDGDVMHFRFNV